jgi:hypothetical protein
MNDFDRSARHPRPPRFTRISPRANPEQRAEDALARAVRMQDSGDHWLGEVSRGEF